MHSICQVPLIDRRTYAATVFEQHRSQYHGRARILQMNSCGSLPGFRLQTLERLVWQLRTMPTM